jgi:hypothetical protein
MIGRVGPRWRLAGGPARVTETERGTPGRGCRCRGRGAGWLVLGGNSAGGVDRGMCAGTDGCGASLVGIAGKFLPGFVSYYYSFPPCSGPPAGCSYVSFGCRRG